MKFIGLMLCPLNFFYDHKNITFEVINVLKRLFCYIATWV